MVDRRTEKPVDSTEAATTFPGTQPVAGTKDLEARDAWGSAQQPLDRSSIWILLSSFAVLALQISNQSLWIDEGGTAFYGLLPTFRDWWQFLIHDPISNSQMPLPLLGAWLTAHSLGTAEWQLRSLNLLWAGGGLVAFYFAGRALGCRWLPALLVIQPYFWFYNNELRPYSQEIFCGTLLVLGTVLFYRDQAQGNRWAWISAAGGVLLGYTTILSAFPIGATALVCGLIGYSRGWRIGRRAWLPLVLGCILLLLAGAYYVWTILRGATVNVVWKGDWKSLCYIFYELTGLSGLGPSLAEIREAAAAKVLPAVLKSHWLEFGLAVLAGMFWALLLASAVWRFIRERRWHKLALLLGIVVLAGTSLTVFGLCMKKVLWARHWAPIFPFYVAAMGLVLKAQANPGGHLIMRRLVTGAWIVLLVGSALSLRFSPKHAKDDYREAAALTKKYLAQGRTVWWVACWECAYYYRVPIGPVDRPERSLSPFCYIIQPGGSNAPVPSTLPVVLISRPSIYDPAGSVRAFVEQNKMSALNEHCHTFTFFVPQDFRP